MKVRNILLIFTLVSILGVTACGNNSVSAEGNNKDKITEKDTQHTETPNKDEKEEPSSNWMDTEVVIYGEKLVLPIKYEKLKSIGFTLSDYDSTKEVKHWGGSIVKLYKDDNTICGSYAYNPYDDTKLTPEVYAWEIHQYYNEILNEEELILFPGNLKVGDTTSLDVLIKLFGEPDYINTEDNKLYNNYSWIEEGNSNYGRVLDVETDKEGRINFLRIKASYADVDLYK